MSSAQPKSLLAFSSLEKPSADKAPVNAEIGQAGRLHFGLAPSEVYCLYLLFVLLVVDFLLAYLVEQPGFHFQVLREAQWFFSWIDTRNIQFEWSWLFLDHGDRKISSVRTQR